MYRILIILTTFFIPVFAMSQTLTFSKAVQQLFFNVDIKNGSPDTIINEFKKLAKDYHVNKGTSSLSVNLNMNMDGNARKVSHVFKFVKSPLPDMVVDTGYIKIDIGEIGNSRKIIDVDWSFQFRNKAEAEMFYGELKKLFKPISTQQKIEDDELNEGQFAEFSTRAENAGGIRDITFFFGKSNDTNKYEVRFLPYNEFAE